MELDLNPGPVAPSLPLSPFCPQALSSPGHVWIPPWALSEQPGKGHCAPPCRPCRVPWSLGTQTRPGGCQSLLRSKKFPGEPISLPWGVFHQALIFTLPAWGGFDLRGEALPRRQKQLCEINAGNVTGSSGAEASVGAEEEGGRPLCDPDTDSPVHVRMRGLQPAAAAPRQKASTSRAPPGGGRAGWRIRPLTCKASLSGMQKTRPGEPRCPG